VSVAIIIVSGDYDLRHPKDVSELRPLPAPTQLVIDMSTSSSGGGGRVPGHRGHLRLRWSRLGDAATGQSRSSSRSSRHPEKATIARWSRTLARGHVPLVESPDAVAGRAGNAV
jgi:hypothetical protein